MWLGFLRKFSELELGSSQTIELQMLSFSVLNLLSSCSAAGQVPCITTVSQSRGIFSSVCLARKHEICRVTISLQLLKASYAKHGLNCREKFYLNPWFVIQIFSLLLAEDK